jgi:hypothetical protein
LLISTNDHVTAILRFAAVWSDKVTSSSSSSVIPFVWNNHHNRRVHPGLSILPVALRDRAIQATEMTRFGDFQTLCRNTPSYPWCNLFYREVISPFPYPYSLFTHKKKQLQHNAPAFLIGASADTSSAPVGVNPKCGIPRVGFESSVGNIANILACSFSILVLIWLIIRCNSRKAAVGESSSPPALSIF